MRARFSAAVLAASRLFLLSLFVPGSAEAQGAGSARAESLGSARARAPGLADARTGDFAVDLLLGLTSGSDQLGASTGVPDGVLNLRDLDAAPILGLGVLFPKTVLGLRPRALVTYATPTDVGGNWEPCDPGFACPEIFLPIDGSASRLQATVGAELPFLSAAGPVRPYVAAGVGLRRYGFSWSAIGEPGDNFRLAAGSYGETDFLARFGLGVGVSLGGFEVLLEGTADLSRFGAGRVPVPEELLALWDEPTIDLGRVTREHYEVVLGVRRHLE